MTECERQPKHKLRVGAYLSKMEFGWVFRTGRRPLEAVCSFAVTVRIKVIHRCRYRGRGQHDKRYRLLSNAGEARGALPIVFVFVAQCHGIIGVYIHS